MSAEKQKTILLVEDDAITAMTEKLALENYGYETVIATNGEEAVAIVEKTPAIDLILMDINMGAGMDGIEATELILSRRDIPVLFLSSHTEPEIVARTERVTSYGYVVKSAGSTVLQASIKMAFKLFKAKKSEAEKGAQRETALKALRESEGKYRLLIANSHDIIFTFSMQGILTFVSPSWNALLGHSPEQVIGKPIQHFVHPDDIESCMALLRKVITTGQRQDGEDAYRVRHIDGSWRWHVTNAVPLRDAAGAIVGGEGIARDITERKRAELVLQAERDRAQQYLDIAGVILVNLAPDQTIVLVNKKGCELLGYGREELMGKNWFDVIVPAHDREGVKAKFAMLIKGELEQSEWVVNSVLTRSGTERLVRWHNTLLRDAAGEIAGTLSSGEDITDHQQVERQKEAALVSLRESEVKYRALVENINDVLYTLDAAGTFTYVSPVIERLSGRKPDEIVGRNFADFVHPDDLPLLLEKFRQTMGGARESFEFRVLNGKEIRQVRTSSQRLIIDGAVAGLTGLMSDISERKESDNTLRESEELYRNIIEQSTEGIVMTDESGRITEWNLAQEAITQLKRGEVLGKPLWEIQARFNPGDMATPALEKKISMTIKSILREDSQWTGGTMDQRILRADRSSKIVQATSFIIKKNKKRTIGVIMHDVTESKQAESVLQDIIDKNPMSIQIVDKDGYTLKVNPAHTMLFGAMPPADFSIFADLQNKQPELEKSILLAKSGEVVHLPDILYNAHDVVPGAPDAPVWIRAVIFPLKDSLGKPERFVFLHENISERKRAEAQREAALETLRESEEQYRTLIKNVGEGIGFVNPEEQFVFANTAAETIFGMQANGLSGRNLSEFVGPEQFAMIREQTGRRQAGENGVYEIDVSRPNGETRNLLITAVPRFDSQGKFLGTFGIFRDISERKEAEEEIKRQLAEKEILLREVHHRIKNNIASIGALISMHLLTVTNPEAIAVLQDAIGRVNSMGILYDKLLLTESYQDVSVKNYIESLVDTVISLFPDRVRINLEKRIDDFKLDPKRLFPLGIIINELITNKMKYAFSNRTTGVIRISLAHVKNHITLSILDDGNELPAGFDINEAKGFGLKLIRILSKQLAASFTMESQAGTKCKLEFDI